MLSKIPSKLDSMNADLQTLQFFTLSANPHQHGQLQGGTQDNGTWQGRGKTWLNTNISDGGHNGFDVEIDEFRFSMFFSPQVFVNFSNGDDSDWNWVSDTFFTNGETQIFYPAAISDPKVSKTMFLGQDSVWRTKTAGQGSMSLAEFRARCNLYTGDFAAFCGDWVRLGPTALTADALGDRGGGDISMIERAETDSTDAVDGHDPRAALHHEERRRGACLGGGARPDRHRLDDRPGPLHQRDRHRPQQPEPGLRHVQRLQRRDADDAGARVRGRLQPDLGHGDVDADRRRGHAGGLPDTPATDAAYDARTGDLYVSNDFGVSLLAKGSSTWTEAATGLPNVMVPSLTLVAEERVLYAATHGFAAWQLNIGTRDRR